MLSTEQVEQDTPRTPHNGAGQTGMGHHGIRRKVGALTLAGTGFLALAVVGCGSSPSATTGSSIGAAQHPAVSLTGSAADLQTAVENDIKTTAPSVVQVTSSGGGNGGEAIGSGEILTSDGYIVTNNHVVEGFSTFQVQLSSGTSVSASLVGRDPNDDLAVLKVNQTGLHPIAVGDSAKVVVGEFVVALGSPLGLSQSATFGIISATNRTATESVNNQQHTLIGMIQTSAPINPGNSGGALVDLSGNLVGIPTLGAVDPSGGQANGIGFAIPSNRMQFLVQQLIQHGQVSNTGEGFLGIQSADAAQQAQVQNLPVQTGVYVGGFAQDTAGVSPAQQAGLQVGDIITAVNGTAISGQTDLSSILLNDAPGTKVQLSIVKPDGSKSTVSVTLGTRPASSQG